MTSSLGVNGMTKMMSYFYHGAQIVVPSSCALKATTKATMKFEDSEYD